MDKPLFTVVIPTLGRPTLGATLLSIRGQASEAVAQIIVVLDTHEPITENTVKDVAETTADYGAWLMAFDAGQHDTGSPQLHLGFQHAAGLFILNCGDDDIYEPGAFDLMAEAVDPNNPIPLMFKVELHPAPHRGNREPVVLWQGREIERLNVTGQSFVCPNDPRQMGRWVDDVTFMDETVRLHRGRIAWREELIARCY